VDTGRETEGVPCDSFDALLGDLARAESVHELDTQPLPAGERLGRFEIVRLLGRGGFGEVYEARDTQLGRRVAVKRIRPQKLAGGSDARTALAELLRSEAETVARLKHPNVVALYDVGAARGETLAVLRHDGAVAHGAWSRDGRRVATASVDGAARVWSADGAGEPVVLRHRERLAMKGVAFSPDGKRLLTKDEGGNIYLWRGNGRGRPVPLLGFTAGAHSPELAFDETGRRALTFCAERDVHLYDLFSWEEALARLNARTNGCLSPADRAEYLGEPEDEAAGRAADCERALGAAPPPR
jgi:hypothetical protein